MAASLDSLSKNLTDEQMEITKSFYTGELFELAKLKGTYPYEYIDHPDRFNETELPSKDKFYSSLNQSEVSDEDYKHAQDVWKAFKCRNLGDYHDLYNKIDVLLLADIFENFRRTCMKSYGLDPAWYFTAPGLTWDAMLKCTKVELDTLDDIDKVNFVERGIRGGLSVCMHRHAKANNRYMNDHDPTQETSYLMYYDINNMYAFAMCQPMPLCDITWDTDVSIDQVLETADDNETGYIVEVDVSYPRELHETHKDLPFLPVRANKLLATLYDKSHYVVHYVTLKQAVENGLIVTKLYKTLKFKQSRWIQPYINLNTQMRIKATNNFEKDFYKLMNNAVFGKTMENVRKRVEIHLIIDESKVKKQIVKANFKRSVVYDVKLVMIEMDKTKVTLNKPIQVGMAVLDVSKTLFYDFHYNYIRKHYGNKAILAYCDTDGGTYWFRGVEDVYKDMKQNLEYFDTSDYPEDNQFGMPRVNKKVLGKMKDENNGKIMTEFVGLRSKMYAMTVQDGKTTKRAKGVQKAVVQKNLTVDMYKDVLHHQRILRAEVRAIRSRHHDVTTVLQNKIALNYQNDKRVILEDGVTTVPHRFNPL